MFGTSDKFDPSKDIPDLTGKVYIVTGGTKGIGFGICAHILEHNPEKLYILGSRDESLCEAYAELKVYGDVSAKVEPIKCDLNNLNEVHEVARKLLSELQRLDALVLNAGLGVGPYELSKDGIDTHMQVNVIAQHHLMMLLLPKLLATPDSRIVMQSSEFHRIGTSGIEFASVEELNQDIGATKLYARTKLALVLIQQALMRRKASSKLGLQSGKAPWIITTHPGAVSTDQQEQAVEAYGAIGKIGVAAVRPFMKDALSEGCRPALYAATDGDISSGRFDGTYIVPDKAVNDISQQAKDEQLQEKCVKLVEGILKDKLGSVISYDLVSQN
ncbi:NAD(P)-binding protein [Polychaeton citri CBS 116435]|uniref:NAD(P)-binding protein n=1 Tax=Polychaeton citri CBS 116435 TaxID=1314669 RepID=A0A9P4Q5Q2_9PEZI|nr:NAD(P)-binding protein [Polychaeton citri CBS 116435]